MYVWWQCYAGNLRETTTLGVLLDWCDEHNLKHYYMLASKIPGYEYFKIRVPYFPLALTVEIPAEV